MMRLTTILLFFCSFSLAQNGDWTRMVSLTNQEKINSDKEEFSTAYWQDYIVYLRYSSRQKKDKDQEPVHHLDLYFTAKAKNNMLERSALLSRKLNSGVHEGPSVFFNGGNQIYFTGTKYEYDELTKDSIPYLHIFESRLHNDEWSTPRPIEQNIMQIHSCHPAINQEGNTLIFSSERPEGYGKMDLYISYLREGRWTEPRNLGPVVNSPENDWFPFLHQNGYLFFSTEEPVSGLEIYRVKINSDGTTGKVLKLPAPFNSPKDDFGLICDRNGLNGYLSSNRDGGMGLDDIYSFRSEKSIFAFGDDAYNLINVTVRDELTRMPFAEAKIRYKKIDEEKFKAFDDSIFLFEEDQRYDSLFTDIEGKASFRIFDGHTLLEVKGPGTESWTKVIANDLQNTNMEIYLIPEKKEAPKPEKPPVIQQDEVLGEIDMNVGSVLVFDNIYYDYNSYEIKKGAAIELDALARILRENKNLKIKLSAHTDARGEDDYNLNLSFKRAIAAKNYLIQRGADPSSILTEGFGESQIRNHCKDGVQCSEIEHNYNRRTEVQILEN